MTTSTQHAEEVLQRLRKRRTTPACYPCFKRKVRCEGGRPCQPCTQRGHPDICHDEDGPRKHRKVKSKAPVQGAVEESAQIDSSVPGLDASLSTSPSTQTRRSPGQRVTVSKPSSFEPQVGKFSAINFVRYKLGAAQPKIHEDVRSGIGLGNTNIQQPSLMPMGPGTKSPDLIPKRDEVLLYFQAFRHSVMTLYPIVFDAAGLETALVDSLSTRAGVAEPAHTGVILACLALGAQFTENVVRSRHEISQDFINRSHAYLQRANYVFHPSIEAVQALLMIGIALQNLGQSDAAWTLLGLNYRLAQSLGLHMQSTGDEVSDSAGLLWKAIVWQDALLSLRYDRVPLSHDDSTRLNQALSLPQNLSYFDAMGEVCCLAIDMLRPPQSLRSNPDEIMRKIETLKGIISRGCEHLQDHLGARTLQQRLEYHALRLHSSLLLAELCRPGFPCQETENDQRRWTIRTKGVQSLVATLEAYLELCMFSNVPLRLWSMTQAAVSCALILALLDSQNSFESTSGLLRRLVKALKMDTSSRFPPMQQPHGNLQGLCLMRAKAVELLESILRREHNVASPPVYQESAMQAKEDILTGTFTDATFGDNAFDKTMSWPTHLSLFNPAFADSVLDFDLDQDWSFMTT